MRRTEWGGLVQKLQKAVIFLMVLALIGAVLYLISDLNQRHYRLIRVDNTLTVERGRFLPMGFTSYEPDTEPLRQAYAPIPIPRGEVVDTGLAVDDRTEIDRALYGRLSGWAKERLAAHDAETLSLGIGYVKRLEILPGLSEEQRHELRGMRADAALSQGEGLMQGVVMTLRHARTLFEQALELGTQHPDRARTGLEDIGHKLSQLGASSAEPAQHGQKTPPLFAPPSAPQEK